MLPEVFGLPPRATDIASSVDLLFWVAVLISGFFSLLIAGLIVYFGVKYRERADVERRSVRPFTRVALEISWSAIPLGITLLLFYWGANVFFRITRPPAGAEEYFVVGRQWMWKIQHPNGAREINQLHVPSGRSIKLTMTSEDVIHSFYLPAFRVKADVIPGRYTTVWFDADRPGTYHLFCAEYCGTEHSKMIGRVVVLSPADYEAWLLEEPMLPPVVSAGDEVFAAHGCAQCHWADTDARAPILTGLLGRTVVLRTGEVVEADREYIRESILRPAAKVVAGYEPIMPPYAGRITEEEILQLIGYMSPRRESGGPVRPGDPGGPGGGRR